MIHIHFVRQLVFHQACCLRSDVMSTECKVDVMTPRAYQQRLRAASAEATRRRILDAMYDELPEIASLDTIARRAGVARSTVYTVFGSRAGLCDALVRDVADRGGFDDLVRAVGAADPLEHLRGAIRANTRMYAAQREALSALWRMADSLDGALARAEQGRLGGLTHLATRLDEAGLLGVGREAAIDLLWLITSFEAFDVLYTQRGRSVDEVADRLVHVAERSVRLPPMS